MDILISSNLERLIYKIAGEDAGVDVELMGKLSRDGVYSITDSMKKGLQDFYGNYADEEETAAEIRGVYEKEGYILDTHTAVASAVYKKYREESQDTATKTVIASTASPYKFTRSVLTAIDPAYEAYGDFELADKLSELSGTKIPKAIEEIRTAPVIHDHVVDACDMPEIVKQFLEI